jgi:hypothetical protein
MRKVIENVLNAIEFGHRIRYNYASHSL